MEGGLRCSTAQRWEWFLLSIFRLAPTPVVATLHKTKSVFKPVVESRYQIHAFDQAHGKQGRIRCKWQCQRRHFCGLCPGGDGI
jgi:hypothetical protein